MKNNYFQKVYNYDKKLFFLVASFAALTIFFNVMGSEVTPFFIWGMYSEREKPTNNYQILEIKINDSTIVDYTSGYPDNNRFFLFSPLSYYKKTKENNFVDPTLTFLKEKLGNRYYRIQPLAEKTHNTPADAKMFTYWYKKYLEQTTGLRINKLEVSVFYGHFTNGQKIEIDSSYLLAKWKQQ